jgi:hypothetical protein
MCFLKEKQAGKHKPEADRQVEKGKVCEKARLEVRKHTVCFFKEESKQENTNWKLITSRRKNK